MKLKITWNTHPRFKKTTILGVTRELPDNQCVFTIIKLEDSNFLAILPLIDADRSKRFIFRDAETARDFCEDFLNYNCSSIIHNQIKQMEKGIGLKFQKSVQYYQEQLVNLRPVFEAHESTMNGKV